MTKDLAYISLQEASNRCNYSQEYLSLRARQGKLKSAKNGRNWVTTQEWLDDYIKNAEAVKSSVQKMKDEKIAKALESDKIKVNIAPTPKNIVAPENLPIGNNLPVVKQNRSALPSVLMFLAFLILFLPSVILGRGNIINFIQGIDSFSRVVGVAGDYFIKGIAVSFLETTLDAKNFALYVSESMPNKFSQASLAVSSVDTSQNFISNIFHFLSKNKRVTSQENQNNQVANGVAQVDKLEMRDQSTGEVYCTWLEDGWMVKVKALCKDVPLQNFNSVK